ncbi:MAG: type II toxin-antitoxin system VapC family toxin [Chitinophagaceae bacterium]
MADNIVLLDTSILIDYYRKTDKNNALWISLIRQGYQFAISAITKYEIYSGATKSQLSFWGSILETIPVIALDENCVDTAVNINAELKKERKQIAIADLFIASTALTHKLPIATLNKKHFERINELHIIE